MLAAISRAKVEIANKCQATLTIAFSRAAHTRNCARSMHLEVSVAVVEGEGGASTGLPRFWPNHGTKLQLQRQQQEEHEQSVTRENATAPSQPQHGSNE